MPARLLWEVCLNNFQQKVPLELKCSSGYIQFGEVYCCSLTGVWSQLSQVQQTCSYLAISVHNHVTLVLLNIANIYHYSNDVYFAQNNREHKSKPMKREIFLHVKVIKFRS